MRIYKMIEAIRFSQKEVSGDKLLIYLQLEELALSLIECSIDF